jgi:hypothetical protein
MSEVIADSILDRFAALFTGLTRAFGQWIVATNKARFVKQKIGRKQWENHLNGVVGLGVVPITEDDTCQWGAIDIDVDDIDHNALMFKVKEANIPLVVCRSKSGGTHCYIFTQAPVKASVLRKTLSGYATMLGYGQSEIFPKQDTLGDGLGSWINLPYMSGNSTNRYAMGEDGQPMSIEEFLDYAEALKAKTTVKQVKAEARDNKGLPPCLRYFKLNGIPEGARNEVLFNFAVYLKKAHPDTWEEEFIRINSTLPKTPLPNKEAQTLIKSIGKKTYNYKCKVPLISNQCDRISCMTLDYGMKDNSNYHEFIVGGITKVTTDPPFWILDVNGTDVRLSTSQLYNFSQTRIRCMEVLGGMIPPMKEEEWRQFIQLRLSTELTVQEAPKDAGDTGRIIGALNEFVRLAARSKKREEITHGIPVLDMMRVDDRTTGENYASNVVMFRSTDFISYMQRKKVIAFLPNNDLWAILREAGCDHAKVRAGKRVIQVWYLPISEEMATEIRSSVTVPEFKEHEL